MVIDPIFSALPDGSSNPVATAIGANEWVRVVCVSGYTKLLGWGKTFYSVQEPEWKWMMGGRSGPGRR
jgi:hypothetical protein